jgi:hypothetical protein
MPLYCWVIVQLCCFSTVKAFFVAGSFKMSVDIDMSQAYSWMLTQNEQTQPQQFQDPTMQHPVIPQLPSTLVLRSSSKKSSMNSNRSFSTTSSLPWARPQHARAALQQHMAAAAAADPAVLAYAVAAMIYENPDQANWLVTVLGQLHRFNAPSNSNGHDPRQFASYCPAFPAVGNNLLRRLLSSADVCIIQGPLAALATPQSVSAGADAAAALLHSLTAAGRYTNTTVNTTAVSPSAATIRRTLSNDCAMKCWSAAGFSICWVDSSHSMPEPRQHSCQHHWQGRWVTIILRTSLWQVAIALGLLLLTVTLMMHVVHLLKHLSTFCGQLHSNLQQGQYLQSHAPHEATQGSSPDGDRDVLMHGRWLLNSWDRDMAAAEGCQQGPDCGGETWRYPAAPDSNVLFGYEDPKAATVIMSPCPPSPAVVQLAVTGIAKFAQRASIAATASAAATLKAAFEKKAHHPAAADVATSGRHENHGCQAKVLSRIDAVDHGDGVENACFWDQADEDEVNELPLSVQNRLAAAGRWARDTGGRLIRRSMQIVMTTVEGARTSSGTVPPIAHGIEGASTTAETAKIDDSSAMLGRLMAASPGTVLYDC